MVDREIKGKTEIPSDIVVHCPLVAKLIKAKRCEKCDKFMGLDLPVPAAQADQVIEQINAGKIPFSKIFKIICRTDVYRNLVEIEED